jgi:hypothetical protein
MNEFSHIGARRLTVSTPTATFLVVRPERESKTMEQGKIGKWVVCFTCGVAVGPFGPITSATIGATHGVSQPGACGGRLGTVDGDGLVQRLESPMAKPELQQVAQKLAGILRYMVSTRLEGEDLGLLLKTARQQLDIPQSEVARRLRASGERGTQTTVGDAERDGPRMLSVAQKIAGVMGLRLIFQLVPAGEERKSGAAR